MLEKATYQVAVICGGDGRSGERGREEEEAAAPVSGLPQAGLSGTGLCSHGPLLLVPSTSPALLVPKASTSTLRPLT